MKLRKVISLTLVLCGIQWLWHGSRAASILPIEPMIQSIQLEGTNVVVEALVSGGARKVTLESRSRLEGSSWEPRAVQRLEPGSAPARTVIFKLPASAGMELLRVRQDDSEPLPDSFYDGLSSFGLPTSAGGPYPGPVYFGGRAEGQAPPTDSAAGDGDGNNRQVVESDIWRIEGDTLYFFNQFRGLQVIDVSQPDAPVLKGTFALPAAGEQMYVMEDGRVVLLARDNCNGWNSSAESQIVLLEVVDGRPVLVKQLPVPGHIRESRLVGSALYVVSETYREIALEPAPPTGDDGAPLPKEEKRPADPVGVSTTWEWGSHVTSFDLSQFSEPVAKSSFWIPGYGNAIQATDRFLFVASLQNQRNWTGVSDIHIFDIASPAGDMTRLSTVETLGHVKDKFKMDLDGDVLRVVTENANDNWKTRVETFSLADPSSPQRLGSLLIIEREQVHATRFAGNLLYAVTFFRIDPLWVIDLSDPANPRKVGELEIPGWSTFIYPWEDRLVTIGIDDQEGWRTAVQLFDVHDPAAPTLVSKVVLGEQYSSSEATNDEKAFGVLPDENLILVPYSTYQDNKPVEGVHLIDLHKDGLTKRGSILHSMQARRATTHRNRILSLSGVELLSVDATDRDNPRVVSSTELSWSVDRVLLAGNYLIEIAAPWNTAPLVRIATTNDPEEALNKLVLDDLPLLGATAANGYLYILQGRSGEVIWPPEWNPDNYAPIATNEATLALSVYSLGNLPELSLASKTETEFSDQYWSNFEALWPKPGLLVWSSSSSFWGYPIPWMMDAFGPLPIVGDAAIVRPGFWPGNSEAHLVAYDVNNPAAAAFNSHVAIRGTNNWWNFSKAFAADGLVFLSHETAEFDPDQPRPPVVVDRWDGRRYVSVTEPAEPGAWISRHYLDVVSYGDPRNPVKRDPVNIPGNLVGISRNGALVYTQGYRYSDPDSWTGQEEWLDASAYDGVAVHLVDSIRLQAWPHPVAVKEETVFLGVASENPAERKPLLEAWTLPDSGEFMRLGAAELDRSAQAFKVFGSLLAVQTDTSILLFDSVLPSALRQVGAGDSKACIGLSLENAAGTLEQGVWIPLGAFGIDFIPANNNNQ